MVRRAAVGWAGAAGLSSGNSGRDAEAKRKGGSHGRQGRTGVRVSKGEPVRAGNPKSRLGSGQNE